MFTDSHCHLNYPRKDGLSVTEQIIQSAEANVGILHTISVSDNDFPVIYDICQTHERVVMAAGVHPCDAHEAPDDLPETLLKRATLPEVVSIGECGLDYYHNEAPVAQQKKVFQQQLEVAQETGLPVVLHTREAETDTLAMIDVAIAKKPFQMVFHCFCGSQYAADFAQERGFYMSVSGVVWKPIYAHLGDVFKTYPKDHVLIETDAPFLVPKPVRKTVKQTTPAHVVHNAQWLADVWGEPDVARVGEITTQNFLNFAPKTALKLKNFVPLGARENA